MRRIACWCVGLISGILVLLHPVLVFSEEKQTAIEQFSYELVYPEAQGDKQLGYFDFKMIPSSQQKLSIIMNNSGPTELRVLVQVNNAKTNGSGEIEYGPSEIERDDSASIELTDVVKGPKEVRIPGNGSKRIELTVELPDKVDPGILLGSIQLQPLETRETAEKNEQSVVKNEFSYIIGLLIRVGEEIEARPELAFNRVYSSFRDGESHLFINYSNTKGMILEEMEVSVSVRKRKKQENLFEYKKTGMRMAPNSMIDFPVELADKDLSAGEYTAQISIQDGEKNHWSWTADFTLSSFDVAAMSNQEVEKVDRSSIVIGAVFIGLVSIVVGLIMKRKRSFSFVDRNTSRR